MSGGAHARGAAPDRPGAEGSSSGPGGRVPRSWPRRGLRVALGLAAGAAMLSGIAAAAVGFAAFPALEVPPASRPGVVAGIFHVHAEASHDGRGTLDEAAAAAAASGARFLILTEHEQLRPQLPEMRAGVLIVPGVELSARAGHVIALGLTALPAERGPGVLEAITAAGGEAILAHPVNLRRPFSDPRSDGFAGFEGLSLDSAFREALREPGSLLLPAAALLGDRRKAAALLLRRPAAALARYDELSRSRQVTLLCGVDAHGLPAYATSFGALRLHARLGEAAASRFGGEPGADAAAILTAIREGSVFCSVPALGDASAFELTATPGPRPAVAVRLPSSGVTLVLYRDGAEVARGPGPELTLSPAPPGSYRAEILASPGFPWPDSSLFVASSTVILRAD